MNKNINLNFKVMSTNCLVTKLKGSVNNDSLSKLGEMKLHVTEKTITNGENQQKFTFGTIVGNEITVRVNGNGYFATTLAGLNDAASRLTSKTITYADGYVNLYFKNDNYDIFISNKYGVRRLFDNSSSSTPCIISVDLSEFEYANSIQEVKLDYSDSVGNIKCFADKPIKTLYLVGTAVSGDISILEDTSLSGLTLEGTDVDGNLSNISQMSTITTLNIKNTTIKGTIASLVNNKNITSLNTEGTEITGSIEEFVEGIISGRTSASNLSLIANGIITVHNVSTNSGWNYSVAFSDNTATVSAGGNVIATYNGSTWSYA